MTTIHEPAIKLKKQIAAARAWTHADQHRHVFVAHTKVEFAPALAAVLRSTTTLFVTRF